MIAEPGLYSFPVHRSGEDRGELAPAVQYPSSAQQTLLLGLAGLKPACPACSRQAQASPASTNPMRTFLLQRAEAALDCAERASLTIGAPTRLPHSVQDPS